MHTVLSTLGRRNTDLIIGATREMLLIWAQKPIQRAHVTRNVTPCLAEWQTGRNADFSGHYIAQPCNSSVTHGPTDYLFLTLI